MYTIAKISADTYWRFLRDYPEASYQQTPQWGAARSVQWKPELVGWFDLEDRLTAVAVLRYRRVPGIRRWLVYIPQGPLLNWSGPQVGQQLDALGAYLRPRGVFAIRITPTVSLRSWSAAAVKAGLEDSRYQHISELPGCVWNPSGSRLVQTLRSAGWTKAAVDDSADASHPQFTFALPLAGATDETVLAGMTKAWRKNIRKAERAGVQVSLGSRDDISAMHRLYGETAQRNGFTPQPEEYFSAMWDTLGGDFPGRFWVHLATHEGEVVAASATAQVGGRAQGVFAATSTQRSPLKPSNALYWSIIRQAIAARADLFDIGGVNDTVAEQDPAAGLVRFKADMGASAHESVGAWDLPLRPGLYAVFTRLLPLYGRATDALRALRASRSEWVRSTGTRSTGTRSPEGHAVPSGAGPASEPPAGEPDPMGDRQGRAGLRGEGAA